MSSVAVLGCHRPRRRLASFVSAQVGYVERSAGTVRRSEYASSQVTVLIGCADPIMIPGRPGGVATVVAGPRITPAVTAVSGRQEGVAFRLSPVEAYATFGVPMRELVDRFVPLEELPGRPGRWLPERLAETPSVTGRLDLVGGWLTRLRAGGAATDPAVAAAWHTLQCDGPRPSVAALAAGLGYTRRHLGRLFADHVGLSPSTTTLVARFERAGALLARGDRGIAEVAARAGYADQAHLHRDLRTFTGRTPIRFVRDRCPAFSDYLTLPDDDEQVP